MRNRRTAREVVLKSLYAIEVGENSTRDVTKRLIKSSLNKDTDALKFAEKLLLVTVDHTSSHDEVIEHHIKNWEVNRLAVIDKLILRMALTELLFFEQIPTKVSINEAIELAKKYSTKKSGNFVNGILDAALTHLKKQDKITKKGRGLIEESNH